MSRTHSCPMGYTIEDLKRRFPTTEEFDDFQTWMVGQTGAICNGQRYDYDRHEYVKDECFDNPHGIVVYWWDVNRYLMGLPVID